MNNTPVFSIVIGLLLVIIFILLSEKFEVRRYEIVVAGIDPSNDDINDQQSRIQIGFKYNELNRKATDQNLIMELAL